MIRLLIAGVGTYLPPWVRSPTGGTGARIAGADEDAVTVAVAAGRAALAAAQATEVTAVIVVSRDLPLMEGGNSAALLAGLGLVAGTPVFEYLGGAPAALDAVATAGAGTLVIGADTATGSGSGAAAVVAAQGAGSARTGRVHRSLPLRTRDGWGSVHADDDPRLERERGLKVALARLELDRKPLAVAGIGAREAAAWCEGDVLDLPTTAASSPLFAIAALLDRRAAGLVVAVEQGSASVLELTGAPAPVQRDEAVPRPLPTTRSTPGPDLRIALAAYDRAFDVKLRWLAGACGACGMLAFPPRHRCLGCGAEGSHELVDLPRRGRVYTATTVHVPVPGLATPYSLAVVELDGVDVRALVGVTGVGPGHAAIGDEGSVVFRRVAVRSGVPDYGYAFLPDHPSVR